MAWRLPALKAEANTVMAMKAPAAKAKGTLRERFHDCRVPDGFVQVADAELDFGRLADVGQDVAVCRTCGDVGRWTALS